MRVQILCEGLCGRIYTLYFFLGLSHNSYVPSTALERQSRTPMGSNQVLSAASFLRSNDCH